MDRLEQRIRALEEACIPFGCNPETMSTRISRVFIDHSLFDQLRLKIKQRDRNMERVWCFSLGTTGAPKDCFYGHTIREAIEKAEKALNHEMTKPPPKNATIAEAACYENGYHYKIECEDGEVMFLRGLGAPQGGKAGDVGTVTYQTGPSFWLWFWSPGKE